MKRAILCVGVALAVLDASAVQARGIDVPLTVANREGVTKTAEPVTSGVPFAQGTVPDAGNVRLVGDGAEVPAQFLATAHWPDGSVRWILLDFQVDLPASGSRFVTLQTGTRPQSVTGIAVTNDANTLTVNTQATTFVFNKAELLVRGQSFQVQSGGAAYQAVPTSWTIEEQGPMKVVVRVDGVWRSGGLALRNDLNRFRARLVFFRGKDEARVWLTFRNNNSFGWDTAAGGQPRQADVVLTGAGFGAATLLASGGSYHLGSGVEKTWETVVPASGPTIVRITRFAADGTLVGGDAPPRPMAAASPDYYASTRAWGRIGLPVSGQTADRQADFDRFERFQGAKVDLSVVENPPGLTGTTVWGHLSRDLASWNDYGDLRWAGNGCGTLSSNHYDWSYGMFLHFMRTGYLAFADAARVFARHEIDFDIYHTGVDGPAFNYQKNWEDRPSHANPDNCFGGGRPSHTWSQGYALQWLLTGDRRGKDAFDEIQEGVRQYVYESFNGEGYVDTSEIRVQGWLVENLVNLWRINPNASLTTSAYGSKTIRAAIQDVLRNVFDREAAAGGGGFVISDADESGNLRQPLVNAYFLEPAIKAYDEVFAGRDAAYAQTLLGLIRRMTNWLMSITYGGDTNGEGEYRPRQIPYMVDIRLARQTEGQLPYLLMAANAAGYLFSSTGEAAWLNYASAAFQDYVRYVGAIGPDSYGDPNSRTPASYNSNMFPGTESKIHGWSSRYGQYFLAAAAGQPAPGIPGAPTGLTASAVGSTVTLSWSAPSSGATAAVTAAVTAYIIEAGSAPGLANLTRFSTGSTATTYSAGGVGDGTYYVRVRATNAAGTSGPSNEVRLVVGCAGPPGAPGSLSIVNNSGGTVVFAWIAASGGPTTYLLEAGTAPGLANLTVLDLHGTATTVRATGVGAGTYYVRLRARNACGTGSVSNEVVLIVR